MNKVKNLIIGSEISVSLASILRLYTSFFLLLLLRCSEKLNWMFMTYLILSVQENKLVATKVARVPTQVVLNFLFVFLFSLLLFRPLPMFSSPLWNDTSPPVTSPFSLLTVPFFSPSPSIASLGVIKLLWKRKMERGKKKKRIMNKAGKWVGSFIMAVSPLHVAVSLSSLLLFTLFICLSRVN